jgi:RNA polymerase sigma factor (sigma-70 family)
MDSEVRSKSEQEAMDQEFSSEDLMARTAGGDEYAFEILVHRHQASVLNLTYRFIGDRNQAKDLAQEVFLRVWQAAKSYKHEAKFTTWIYRITANLCFNELKSSRRKKWFQFFQSGAEGGKTIEETLSGILMGYFFSYLLGFLSIPVAISWELNLLPAFAKAEAASQNVRLPVSISGGLVAISLALSIVAGVLASYVMGKRTARMKPVEILRQL